MAENTIMILIAIDWMVILPAPESILELLSYICVKSCNNNRVHAEQMALLAPICVNWKTIIVGESDDDNEPDNDSEILDDSDEDEI